MKSRNILIRIRKEVFDLTTPQASTACYRNSFTFLSCGVFIVCNVSFIVCVALIAVLYLSVVVIL
jgi:hypothetical protein